MGATVRCTNCDQSWLVPGLRNGEAHVCKGCGQRLLVGGRASRPSRVTGPRGAGARDAGADASGRARVR